ncbi:hypothetical protein DY000_02040226 [Brassica cretica]|uniref:Uncharacterized protein n=1 Tax=Brassica cretica TaxID=69181 RepID=A0ABQ7B5N2_BRACR|nr:hypothetical protein DY000_02040226 [Brassica cretica]
MNGCIKSDASAHAQECMSQDPRILRGRILARLRTRGMSRFSKTRRPKLRILMLDSTGLAFPLELLKAVMDFREDLCGFLAAFSILDTA